MRSERQPLLRLEALVLAALPVSAGVLSPQALAIRPTAAIAGMLLGMLTAEITWPRSLSSGAQQAALASQLRAVVAAAKRARLARQTLGDRRCSGQILARLHRLAARNPRKTSYATGPRSIRALACPGPPVRRDHPGCWCNMRSGSATETPVDIPSTIFAVHRDCGEKATNGPESSFTAGRR
jgi:hypothetical protein